MLSGQIFSYVKLSNRRQEFYVFLENSGASPIFSPKMG